MFYKLENYDYKNVKELFKKLDNNLQIESILERHNGLVFVDNVKKPLTACIYDCQHNFYIVGNVDNKKFNEALKEYMLDNIFPSKKMNDALDFYIYSDPVELWEKEFTNLFLQHHIKKINRKYYIFDTQKYNFNYDLPDGYVVKRIDEELLSRTDLKNIEDIIEWTSTESWISKDDFLKNGFGFCIVNGNDIVSWCISDYVMGNKCEIGIETDEGYRKNGFATIVVSVCIKYCIENNIDHIGWHCFESNIGSQKTAEKVGFTLCKEYKPLFGWYNGFDNFLVHAYDYYTNKNYAEASKLYEKAFRLLESNNKESKISNICNENNKYWFYFNAARANAYINNIYLAYDKLKKSIEMGLSDKNMIINDDAFKKLINLNDFYELIHKIK